MDYDGELFDEDVRECNGHLDSKLEFLNQIIQPLPMTKGGGHVTKPKKRKTSSTTKRKPLIKTIKSSEPYDQDEKIREKVRYIVGKLFESRGYLNEDEDLSPEKLYRWVMEFLSERGYWPIEAVKDKFIISLYAVFTGLRLRGIFLDPHLLSLDFEVPFKVFQKCIFECTPFVTCETEIEKKIIRFSVSLDRFSIYREYSNILRELVPNIEAERVKAFEDRCQFFFDLLSQKGVCDEEKQFCVTADKIFIYGLFETMKKHYPEKTERVICDQLSERFCIPRVTIEKMKRLINKTLKTPAVRNPPEPYSK